LVRRKLRRLWGRPPSAPRIRCWQPTSYKIQATGVL